MFGRHYGEYVRFKNRLETEMASNQEQGFAREQTDYRFTYEFVQNLIRDAELIDIDIYS